jgi:WD40 repeat protein
MDWSDAPARMSPSGARVLLTTGLGSEAIEFTMRKLGDPASRLSGAIAAAALLVTFGCARRVPLPGQAVVGTVGQPGGADGGEAIPDGGGEATGPAVTPRSPTVAACGSFARDPLTATALAHAPDGSRLAAGFQDDRVRIYRLPGGELERTLPRASSPPQGNREPPSRVTHLAFSPDGKLLAVAHDNGASDYRLDTYAVDTGALVSGSSRTAAVNLAFSGDSSLLLVTLDPARVASNRQQQVVNVSVGRVLATFASSQRAAWADSGESVIVFDDSSTAGDGVYTVYFAASGEVTRRGSVAGPALDWRPLDGNDGLSNHALAIVPGSGGSPSQLALFSFSPFDPSPTTRAWLSPGSVIAGQRVDTLPENGGIAVFAGQTVSVLSVDTGTLVRSLSLPSSSFAEAASLAPDGESVVGVDGDRLVEVGSDGSVVGSPFDTRGNQFGPPAILALSGDGQMLASGVAESPRGIWLWNVADRSFGRQLTGAGRSFTGGFSPGNTLFVGADQGASVWKVSDGTMIDTLQFGIQEGFDISVPQPTSAAFSPDGSLIAYGQPTAIEIRRVSDGTTMRSLAVAAPSRALAFSADGALLATSAPELFRVSDGTLVWSKAASSREAPVATGEPYDTVSFTPDGNALLVSQCDYDPWSVFQVTRPICSPPKLVRLSDGATLREYPAGTGARPQLSPDGTWMVAGPDLVDMASGARLPLGVDARFSVFLDATTIAAETTAGDIEVICLH